MILDIRPRHGGKSYDLIKESARTGFPILCESSNRVNYLIKESKSMGLTIPTPITASEVLNNSKSLIGVRGLLIDNLDLVLTRLLRGVQVPIATYTGEATINTLPLNSNGGEYHNGNIPY